MYRLIRINWAYSVLSLSSASDLSAPLVLAVYPAYHLPSERLGGIRTPLSERYPILGTDSRSHS